MIKDRNIADDAAIMIYKILGGAALGMGDLFVVGTSGTAAYNWWRSRIPSSKMFQTVKTALAACTAGRNDKIICLPQSTEAIIAAATLDINKAGVEIIGVGTGSYRPTWTLSTAAAATLAISAANVKMSNIYIDSTGVAAVAVGITVTGAGLNMSNVEHYFAKTSYVTVLGMTFDSTATATNVIIDNCYMHGDAAANCTQYMSLLAGGANFKVTGSIIHGSFSVGTGCITSAAAVTNYYIVNNVLVNETSNSLKTVVMYTGSTGILANNRSGLVGTATVPFSADTGHWIGNWAGKVATDSTLM